MRLLRRLALPMLLLLALLLFGWCKSLDPEVGDARARAPIRRDAAAPDVPPLAEHDAPDEAEPAPRLVGTGREEPARAAGASATLRCRVQGPDGEPRPRSLVQLERAVSVELTADMLRRGFFEAPTWIQPQGHGGRRADVHGLVSFAELPPGRYRVQALAPPGLLAPEARVDLGAADVDVDLAYRQTVSARIEVLDAEGRPVAQAGVTLERGHAKSVTTDGAGIAMLEELDPRWDVGLRIRPPRGRDLFDRTLDPWTVGDTRVILEASLSVSGSVVD